MNARMYAVTAEAEAQWRSVLEHVTADAGLQFSYLSYPAPQPLEPLWSRDDLGAVFMCGFPIALKMADIVPLAAPVPRAEWSAGRAVYRSDLIVRSDSRFQTLADTFGGSAGFTVAHSHSGFNAWRHHLLRWRSPQRPHLYSQMHGELITARRILDSVREGRIDIGPLDAFWHLLLRRYAPELTDGIRVLESTELAPLPCFVCSAAAPAAQVAALRAAFVSAAQRPWFAGFRDSLQIDGFAAVSAQSYDLLLDWDREAHEAGYPLPA